MFLTKSNMIISFCLLTSFISANYEFLVPRFSKEGEKYYVHLMIDDDELKLKECKISSGYHKNNTYYSKSVSFKTEHHRMGRELIIDITDIPKNLPYAYDLVVYTDEWFNFKSYEFAFSDKEDNFILYDRDYEADFKSDSDSN
ncbi:hypothetical protein NBO_355g0002 [Nosema bombycis CQ1]|uniref:Uncharacterized protein n=1 Tax=Nosema bombycis (strain CQ1 / CVCC 102059) TaxID=578461 RepID=R0M4F0_NOSB1|nr:hypothetical protein NBO_355g0002 [Nosema bombycis CQ1]|eukprot:EOB12854.1 hypothetical protein NBO_355g0002 [Nosema bombycis CQ1]